MNRAIRLYGILTLLWLAWGPATHSAEEPARTPEQWAEILSAAYHPQVDKATKALQALNSKALPALRSLLKNPDPEVRARALGVIDSLVDEMDWQGQDAALATDLAHLLRNEPVDALRTEAATILENMKARAAPAIPALIEALSDPESEVSDHAKDALSAIGIASRPALLEQLPPKPGRKNFTRRLAVEALGDIEPKDLDTLKGMLPLLNDTDHEVSEETAKSLPSQLSLIPGGTEWLLKLLKENDALAGAAAFQLGKGQATEARSALTEALQSPSADVRVQAALALIRLSPAQDAEKPEPSPEIKQARTTLIAALDDPEVKTRAHTMELLGLTILYDKKMMRPRLMFTVIPLAWLRGDASTIVGELARRVLAQIDKKLKDVKVEPRAEFQKRPADWTPPAVVERAKPAKQPAGNEKPEKPVQAPEF